MICQSLDIASVGAFLKEFGGWGVFALSVWFGGRALLTVLREGFNYLGSKIEDVGKKVDELRGSMQQLSGKVDQVDDRVERLETHVSINKPSRGRPT